MQLAHISRRITKKYNFEIICIQGRSASSKDFYSYGEGSNKLSKDFNLNQPYGKNFFLQLDSILSIDKYEEHFKKKGYSYIFLEHFIEDKSYHKVTRTSDKDILGLTSLQIEKEFEDEKLLKKERSLSRKIHKTSLYSFKGKSFDDQESYRKSLAQSPETTNAYKPWTAEEEEILQSSDNKTVKELASILRRRTGAIRSRLNKIDVKNDKSKFANDNLFFSSILKGIDPITAEILPNGHAWLHPKIISDIKEHIKNIKTNKPQSQTKKNHSFAAPAISESKDKLTQPGVDSVCSKCGELFNCDRANLGYKTCLACGENEAHKNAPKLDEGLPGTREENKKMRGQVWGEIRNRSKGN